MKQILRLGIFVSGTLIWLCFSSVMAEMLHGVALHRAKRDVDPIPWNMWNSECQISFDEVFMGRLNEAIHNCASYNVGQRMRNSNGDVLLTKNVNSAQKCHTLCFTYSECVAFKWSSSLKRCYVLKKIKSSVTDSSYVSGLRNDCTENLDNNIKDYFANPLSRQEAAKDSFLKAKQTYTVSVASRTRYSKVSTTCLAPLIEFGAVSEEELGVAPGVKAGEVPFSPDAGVNPSSKQVNIQANSGPMRMPINNVLYDNWIITGLYAPPGKIITVISPNRALTKFKIIIGANNDKLYNKESLVRDPEVSMTFDITKGNQAIGSPYGGLIIIQFKDAALEGENFEMRFENVLEAPHFVLGKHTNEEWNNQIKSEDVPWSIFEIPKKITFIVPSTGEYGAYQLEDVTFNLEEWRTYMEMNDLAAGISYRPVGELIVLDSQIYVGYMHALYPIMVENLNEIVNIIPGRSLNDISQSVGIGHEIGHNNQLEPWRMLSHVTVNLFSNFALPKMRKGKNKWGTWGRESRLLSYIKAGKPVNLAANSREYDIWSDVLKIPMDGLDGSGWQNDGNWNDLPAILAPYRDLPKEQYPSNNEEAMDLWVKNYCNVKEMNMVPYFDFWQFPITSSTRSACQQHLTTPTEIMSWVNDIERMANEEDACPGEDWFGDSNKCFKISEGQYTYQGAGDYCAGLEGSASLASITSRDDATLINFAYLFKPYYYGAWIESVGDPAETFPYADSYYSEDGKQVILGGGRFSTQCHYSPSKEDLNGVYANCVGPVNRSTYNLRYALCQK